MDIVRGLENAHREDGALTVGSFDGLHLGHQRIIRSMRRSGLSPVTIMTFEPHPQAVTRPDSVPPPLLTTFDGRCRLFEFLGVHRLVVVHFDADFAQISAEDFVKRILIDTVGMSAIFIGPGHGFGKGRRGNAELLGRMGAELGFQVSVVQPIEREGNKISSSVIRKLLAAGDAERAMNYLGRPHSVEGEVIRGDGRGKSLGFPTANQAVADTDKLIPAPGIYASVAEVGGDRFPSVTHLGARPTFAGTEPAFETHIIDFDREIYGEVIRVGLVARIRDIVAFKSVDELVSQMEKDRDNARLTLARLGFNARTGLRFKRLGSIVS